MRLAFISDIHGDLRALEDALHQAGGLSIDKIVCLGDVIDGDAFSEEVVGLLRTNGILTLRGNHERWVTEGGPEVRAFGSGVELSHESTRWLRELPTTFGLDVMGARIRATHARPGCDMAGIYPARTSREALGRILDEAGADVLVVGHTHERFCVGAGDGRIVCNPGALWRGAGSGGNGTFAVLGPGGKVELQQATAGGTFGILDLPARRFEIRRASDGEIEPMESEAATSFVQRKTRSSPPRWRQRRASEAFQRRRAGCG